MLRVFSFIHTSDEILQKVQSNVDLAFRKLFQLCPLLEGTLVKDVALTTTNQRVEHKLGRKPNGYIVVRQNGSASVYDSAGYSLEDQALLMRASASVTVTLWVF